MTIETLRHTEDGQGFAQTMRILEEKREQLPKTFGHRGYHSRMASQVVEREFERYGDDSYLTLFLMDEGHPFPDTRYESQIFFQLRRKNLHTLEQFTNLQKGYRVKGVGKATEFINALADAARAALEL